MNESLTLDTGVRHTDLVSGCRGTITKLQRKDFLAWSLQRVTWRELVEDTLSNTVVLLNNDGLLPIPLHLDLQPYINDGAATTFKAWRNFFELDKNGYTRAKPRDPQPNPVTHEGGWDIYRPEQFVFNGVGEADHGNDALTLTIVARMHEVLSDEQMELVRMLGDGATYEEIACELAPEWVGSGRRPSDWVNSRLRTVRSRVTGLSGSVTQAMAGDWLEEQ